MKSVRLRLAAAAVAISICFGASARARVDLPAAPIRTSTNSSVISPELPTTVVVVVAAVAAVVRAVTKPQLTHSLEQIDPAAQFDVNR